MAVPFEYAVLRVVPRVDRGEFLNGAVLLYCQAHGYLGARVRADLAPVAVLSAEAEVDVIREALEAVVTAVEDPIGVDPDPGRRFRWMTAPRSAVIQPGPVHTGLTDDPTC